MTSQPLPRIALVDAARTLALCGMILFHFVFDLEMFGHVPPGTVAMPEGWAILARVVAGSFLFLAGVSLVLAHGRGIRWRAFLRRLAILVAAAGAITAATRMAMPQGFIYFGILHAIAAFSVIGLLFLRLPWGVTLAVALAVAILPGQGVLPAVEGQWLLWLGLSTVRPYSMDFVPLFPWFGAFLAGMALTRAAMGSALWPVLSLPPGERLKRLTWPGRHSLAVYLVHQPVLIGSLWVYTRLFG